MFAENWGQLTPDQKFEARMAAWVATEGKPFATPEAAQLYRERTSRYVATIKLQATDRVPRTLISGDLIAHYAGCTPGDFFYDYDKTVQAIIKFHQDFDLDYGAASNFLPGPMLDKLQYKLYRWPGQALPATQSFQFVEGEYMRADEYDALIADPEGFCMRTYMPRIFGILGPWQMLPTFFGSTELPFVPFMMAPFSAPPLQEAFKAFLEAGQMVAQWFGANGQAGAVTLGQLGLPGTFGGFSKAPFDFIGDSLRGTRGIMLDMYRQPNKVLAAVERLVPMTIQMAASAANASGTPFVLIPLHKGADGFMSTADFKKFYWPTLKALILGLIEEGVVPCMFVEGGYNQRLDAIAESGLPAGRSFWIFDQSDMAEVKKKIGSWACIAGNVPASLFKAGTPAQMEAYVKKVIDTCAPGGGFMISPGAVIDQAETENVHTYFKAALEYGVY